MSRVQAPRVKDELYLITMDSPAYEEIIKIKIGRADNTYSRLPRLQTGCPYPLRVLHVEKGAGRYEIALHQFFDPQRRQGEWFDFPSEPDPVEEILAALVHLGYRASWMRPALGPAYAGLPGRDGQGRLTCRGC